MLQLYDLNLWFVCFISNYLKKFHDHNFFMINNNKEVKNKLENRSISDSFQNIHEEIIRNKARIDSSLKLLLLFNFLKKYNGLYKFTFIMLVVLSRFVSKDVAKWKLLRNIITGLHAHLKTHLRIRDSHLTLDTVASLVGNWKCSLKLLEFTPFERYFSVLNCYL